MANMEEIWRAVKQIEEYPELHFQQDWLQPRGCGTAGCLAGWSCMINGWVPAWDVQPDLKLWMKGIREPKIPVPHAEAVRDSLVVNPETGQVWHPSTLAMKIMDLNVGQQSLLFRSINTREEIRTIAEMIEGGATNAEIASEIGF